MNRRNFLKRALAIPAALGLGVVGVGAVAEEQSTTATEIVIWNGEVARRLTRQGSMVYWDGYVRYCHPLWGYNRGKWVKYI